jgi:hypothetical protein
VSGWFERYLAALDSAGVDPPTREEIRQVLEVAGAAARAAGARQFAPVAAYLAGQAAAGRDAGARVALLLEAAAAAAAAGPSPEPLDSD